MPSVTDLEVVHLEAVAAPAPEFLSYILRFPAELEADQVTTWLHALSGLLPGGLGRLRGAPAVSLELLASAEYGFRYCLTVPRTKAEYVVGQLRTAVPGVRATPGDAKEKHTWTRVVELGTRRHERTVRVEPVPLVGSLLASLQGFALGRHEVVMMQWIIRPAVPERPPIQASPRPVRLGTYLALSPQAAVKDAVADKRVKLSSVNFLACLRIGVQAGSDERAGQLLGGIRAALTSTRTPQNTLYVRTSPQGRLHAALDSVRVPLLFPMQLTAEELTGVLAWPIGSPHVAGLPQSRSRHLPPSGGIARRGLVVAQANFPGAERHLALILG